MTPPRLHKHRYSGVLAPNAALREAVTASAPAAGRRSSAVRLTFGAVVGDTHGVSRENRGTPCRALSRLPVPQRDWALRTRRTGRCVLQRVRMRWMGGVALKGFCFPQ